jgi:hypothetical protein
MKSRSSGFSTISRFRPSLPLHRQPMSLVRAIAARARVGVAADLSADGGWMAAQLGSDRPDGEAFPKTVSNGQPFLLGQEPDIDRRRRPEHRSVVHLPPGPGHVPPTMPPPLTGLPRDPDDPAGCRVVHSLQHEPEV